MKKFYAILLALTVILSAFMLTGCGKIEVSEIDSAETDSSETNPPEAELVISDESGDIEVSTDYCALHYPSSWADSVNATIESENGIETVGFYGDIDNHEKQLLFEIVFNSDEGDELGTLGEGEDAVAVCMNVPKPVFDESWSEDEQTTFFAMQEDVNYVVEELCSIENFTPSY